MNDVPLANDQAPHTDIFAVSRAAIKEGFGVVPLIPRTKKPLNKAYTSCQPILDPQESERLLGSIRSANLAIVPRHHLIIDIDPRNGGDDSFDKLIMGIGELPDTVEVTTGGGGRHLYYHLPNEIDPKKLRKTLTEFQGIDFLTKNYAVAPPSIHENGNPYKFVEGRSFGEIPVAEAPVALVELLQKQGSRTLIGSRDHPGPSLGRQAPPRNMDRVAAGCAYVEQAINHREALPEPTWYDIACIAAHTPDGWEWFHEFSSADPRYKPEETQQKLEHAQKDSGPLTCRFIGDERNFEGCKTCLFKGRITSPINLQYTNGRLLSILRYMIIDTLRNVAIDTRNGEELDSKGVNSEFQHLFENSPFKLMTQNRYTLKVRGVDYVPGEDRLIQHDNGRFTYNLYSPCLLVPSEGGHPTIDEHFRYLFPNEKERDHILDVLAHLVQKPGEKIRHMIIVIGNQGTGKSWLAQLIKRLVGDSNIAAVQGDILTSPYQRGLTNKQVIVIEEMMTFEKMDVSNRLKRFITEEKVDVEDKFARRTEARAPRLLIGFSNHDYPIRIEESDRRYFVTKSNAQKRDQLYYDALWKSLDDEVGAFFYTLLHRDITHFSPNREPPLTNTKKYLIEVSRPEIEQAIERLKDDPCSISRFDFFIPSELWGDLERELGRKLKTSEKTKVKQLLNLREKQVRLHVAANPQRIYIYKNQEEWMNADTNDLRERWNNERVRTPVGDLPK